MKFCAMDGSNISRLCSESDATYNVADQTLLERVLHVSFYGMTFEGSEVVCGCY